LNTGIKEAKNEWLIFSDDDIILSAEWLASVLKTVKSADFKCFFGKIVSRWLVEEPVWFDSRMRSVIVNADHGDQIKFPMNYLVGANMGIHRDVFKECGVFDETRKRYEDAEISLRIRKKFDIVYVPDVVIDHPVTADRITKSYFRKWYYEMGCFEKFVIDLNDKPLFKIPRWIYRQNLTHAWKMMTAGKESERFYHELQLHRFKGFIQTIWGNH
jgi:GT2 family glycosyltransferase